MADPKLKLQIRPYDLVSNAGLALVGEHLNRHAQIHQLDKQVRTKTGAMPISQVLSAYVGLLAMGKSDFDAIERLRKDKFFPKALFLKQVPSPSSLRLRIAQYAEQVGATDLLHQVNERFLRLAGAQFDAESGSVRVMCDIDVFTQDNSGTHKEGVKRTYAGFDGFAPIADYLGQAGWCIGMQLRPGSQHSNSGSQEFVLDAMKRVRRLVPNRPVLMRLDSGFCCAALAAAVLDAQKKT